MMWNFDTLNSIHLELSSKCNAACPQCPRFLDHSPNVDPNLFQTDISFDTFKKWFSPSLLKKIDNWIICGTHGDPITCIDFLDIIKYICEYSNGSIQINTNGGLRGIKFFKQLGNIFQNATVKDNVNRLVVFSIDGLEDTNHLYRRNVKWSNVFENLKAYKSTGAYAAWDFLRFYHNNHQINKAREIAESLNVEFRLKNPFGVSDYAMPVNDNNYNLEYTIYHYTKEPTKTFTPNTRNYTAPLPDPNFVTNGCITCNSFRDNIHEVYIDHLGRVHPCCFIGGDINSLPYMDIVTEVKHIQKILGKQNNLYYYSLEEIMNNNILSLYSNSWADKTVKKCWIQCGKKNSNRSVDNLFVEN